MPLKIVSNAYELVIPASFLPNFGKHEAIGSAEDAGVTEYTFEYELEFVSPDISFVGAPDSAQVTKTSSGYRVKKEASTKFPRRELRFFYKTQDMLYPQLNFKRSSSNDGEVAVMMNLVPTFEPPQPQEFCQAEEPSAVSEINGEEFSYVFIVDRSGSMGGRRMEIAKEALQLFI